MKTLLNRIVIFFAILVFKTFNLLVTIFAKDEPVLTEDEIPFSKFLKDNRLVFLREYSNFLKENQIHNVKDYFKVGINLYQDENWKGIPLVLFDYLFIENAHKFSETIKLSKQLPGCRAVMFLVAGPGKHIPPHRGDFKGIYRCLFTLQLPENADCWIRVDDQKIYFEEGEVIVFDETFEHEVMNASPAPRIVLSFDFFRKLPFPLSLMSSLIFFMLKKSFFVRNILKEYQKLENQSFGQFKSTKASLP